MSAVEPCRDDLADDEQAALEIVFGRDRVAAADENLLHHRLDRLDALAEDRAVDRHVAPAEHGLALAGDREIDGLHNLRPRRRVSRHEELADRVMAGRGQGEAQLLAFRREEIVGDLGQHAAAVAEGRIGADRAAMVEIDQDLKALLEDGVRLAVLHVGHKADAAGIVLLRRVVEAVRAGGQRVGAGAERLVGGSALDDLTGCGVHLSAPRGTVADSMQLSFQNLKAFRHRAAPRAAERLHASDFFLSVFVVRYDNAVASLIRPRRGPWASTANGQQNCPNWRPCQKCAGDTSGSWAFFWQAPGPTLTNRPGAEISGAADGKGLP